MKMGHPVARISRDTGIGERTIKRWLRDYDLFGRVEPRQRKGLIQNRREKAHESIRLMKEDWTLAEIGKRFGCSQHSVSTLVSEYLEGKYD